jgi:hypothetical protein
VHRLFHTLVVCGAGLTLVHCGGKSNTDEEPSDAVGGEGGSSSPENGGEAGVGGSVSMGGSVESSGMGGTGGTIVLGDPVPPAKPTERWSCSQRDCVSDVLSGESCWVAANRPAGADECGPAEIFACMAASLEGAEVRTNCECVPRPENDADCPCPSDSGCLDEAPYPGECSDGASICRCASTCIL